jgi:hypothetical protein
VNQSLLEFAELAGLESLQYEIEGFCAYAGASGEGMLHGPYGEKHQPDHRRQGHNHQPVCPRVLQTKQVGEAYGCYPSEDQNGPEDCGDASSAATRRILLASRTRALWPASGTKVAWQEL